MARDISAAAPSLSSEELLIALVGIAEDLRLRPWRPNGRGAATPCGTNTEDEEDRAGRVGERTEYERSGRIDNIEEDDEPGGPDNEGVVR